VRPIKFRYNAAIVVAAVIAFFGAVPLASSRWYLTPILLVPIALAAWGLRAGTNADENGVRLRALLGTRRIPWSEIAGLAPDEHGHVYAALTSGAVVRLPAVNERDLPRLVAASGHQPSGTGPDGQ